MNIPASAVLADVHEATRAKTRHSITLASTGGIVAILLLATSVFLLALSVNRLTKSNNHLSADNRHLQSQNDQLLQAVGRVYAVGQQNAATLRGLGGKVVEVPVIPPFSPSTTVPSGNALGGGGSRPFPAAAFALVPANFQADPDPSSSQTRAVSQPAHHSHLRRVS